MKLILAPSYVPKVGIEVQTDVNFELNADDKGLSHSRLVTVDNLVHSQLAKQPVLSIHSQWKIAPVSQKPLSYQNARAGWRCRSAWLAHDQQGPGSTPGHYYLLNIMSCFVQDHHRREGEEVHCVHTASNGRWGRICHHVWASETMANTKAYTDF